MLCVVPVLAQELAQLEARAAAQLPEEKEAAQRLAAESAERAQQAKARAQQYRKRARRIEQEHRAKCLCAPARFPAPALSVSMP